MQPKIPGDIRERVSVDQMRLDDRGVAALPVRGGGWTEKRGERWTTSQAISPGNFGRYRSLDKRATHAHGELLAAEEDLALQGGPWGRCVQSVPHEFPETQARTLSFTRETFEHGRSGQPRGRRLETGGRSVRGPWPVFGRSDEGGAHRIQRHVSRKLE